MTNSKQELYFYNYLTRKKDIFVSTQDPVGLYTCGPTVYGVAHIGNLRTFLFEDILRRTLTYFGYQVNQVMNLTDVEDKIIRSANVEKIPITSFTSKYIARFHADLKKLNITPAEHYPLATDHIPEMIEIIQKLLENGVAYESDGSVYFAIRQFPAYGKLSGVKLESLKAGARVDVDEYDKEAAEDFVLWKAAKPEDEAVEAVWDSPWGKGRPGWHIECSAMSMKYLGETFDIHTGGIDLLFPHHEDEIAQSEAATGKPFARFFLEGEHILIDGQKMSKSLGNVTTLDELEKEGIDPLALRYLVLTAHYRTKLNFTWESLKGAEQTLKNLRELQYRGGGEGTPEQITAIDDALADDLDTPRAMALLHDAQSPALWQRYDAVLGLGLQKADVAITPEDEQLLQEREAARTTGDFTRSDAIRDQFRAKGLAIEDTPTGARLVPIKN